MPTIFFVLTVQIVGHYRRGMFEVGVIEEADAGRTWSTWLASVYA